MAYHDNYYPEAHELFVEWYVKAGVSGYNYGVSTYCITVSRFCNYTRWKRIKKFIDRVLPKVSTLRVLSSRPGAFIGREGTLLDTYRVKFKAIGIDHVEILNMVDPDLIASEARSLKKRMMQDELRPKR